MADCCTIANQAVWALGTALVSLVAAIAAYIKAHTTYKQINS